MRVLLIGYNDGVLGALDEILPGGVVVVEEPDLWEGKNLAVKASRHPSLAEVRFGRYQQDEQFLEVVADIDAAGAAGAVDAVAPGLEYAVPAAARAAETLGLRGAGSAAAGTLCDKLALREATAAAGMPTPRFQEIKSALDIADFARGRACVVKPAGRQASLGVVLLDEGAALDEIHAAWRECAQADEGPQLARRPMAWRYLVEDRLAGPELSTECLVDDGAVRFVNVTAKRTAAGNRPVELGHRVPAGSELSPGAGPSAGPGLWRRCVEQLVAAVGFGSGILHAEWMLTSDGPYLIECAGRPPGDRILDLIDLAYGTNITREWLRLLAGQPGTPPARATRGAAIRFLTGGPGVVADIGGVEEARRQPGVQRVDILRKPGDVLAELTSSWGRVGSVIAVADTALEAERRAEQAARRVYVALR